MTPRTLGNRVLRYAPYYCEENIFHLAEEPALASRRREVVFISNSAREVAIFHQRAAGAGELPMFWDYHVVLLVSDPWEIWDFDTTLPFPCRASDYLARSFPLDEGALDRPRFRTIDASLFVRDFASDRSHMRTATGEYTQKPPPWPPIGLPGAPSNLDRFVDMETPFSGDVLEKAELLARVLTPAS